jgi:hypothetical protein
LLGEVEALDEAIEKAAAEFIVIKRVGVERAQKFHPEMPWTKKMPGSVDRRQARLRVY